MAADDLLSRLGSRRGHFALESGNHGDRWLEIDRLFDDPAESLPFARLLAQFLEEHDIEAVSGPSLGGGVLARQIAQLMGLPACVAQRIAPEGGAVRYQIDDAQACVVAGQRVAVVDDVIGAGSAVKATLCELRRLAAIPVVIGALLESGLQPGELARQTRIPVVSLGSVESGMWHPSECPLCRLQVPLEVLFAIP